MKFLSWKNNKFSIFKITIFKFRCTNKLKIYFLNILLIKFDNKFCKINSKINSNENLDVKIFDNEISLLFDIKLKNNLKINKNKIAFLATRLYDTGGHTKCLKDLVESLSDNYQMNVFLTDLSLSRKIAPKSIHEISKFAKIDGIDADFFLYKRRFKKLIYQIINSEPILLFIFIHPCDVISCAVISKLKKQTNIKLVFYNHSSHCPNLAMSFAKIILEGNILTEKITNEKRGFKNTYVIGLQSKRINETKYYSNCEISKKKIEIGVSPKNFLTMSGGTSHKFFEENDSPYFRMIKNLLNREPLLKHVIISEFDNTQKKIIKKIFENEDFLLKKIIFIDLQTSFDFYFQCADVFIDSFPISSALTQVDLMRNKVASVVKINNKNPEYSFHEYQKPNYKYMFSDTKKMELAILDLLYNAKKRQILINENYEYWLKKYEFNVVKKKYLNFINNIILE